MGELTLEKFIHINAFRNQLMSSSISSSLWMTVYLANGQYCILKILYQTSYLHWMYSSTFWSIKSIWSGNLFFSLWKPTAFGGNHGKLKQSPVCPWIWPVPSSAFSRSIICIYISQTKYQECNFQKYKYHNHNFSYF